MATNTTTDDGESVSDDQTTQSHEYGPGGDYVDQRFLDEGRYDY